MAIKIVVDLVRETGATILFLLVVIRTVARHGVSMSQVVDQIYVIGFRSLPTTIMAGSFVGAIMAIQINLQLRDFGAQAFLGGLATSVTIRNVGPVLIAFMLSGKVGAYTSAELGTMRVTEQIDAIRCLGTDPIQYIIAPRMIGVVVSSFLLLIIGLMVGIGGGMAVSEYHLGISAQNYIQNIPRLVSWSSVATGIVKSFVFGVLIGAIACYKGYSASEGAAGVGRCVKRTAVETLVSIIVADFAISSVSAFWHELAFS